MPDLFDEFKVKETKADLFDDFGITPPEPSLFEKTVRVTGDYLGDSVTGLSLENFGTKTKDSFGAVNESVLNQPFYSAARDLTSHPIDTLNRLSNSIGDNFVKTTGGETDEIYPEEIKALNTGLPFTPREIIEPVIDKLEYEKKGRDNFVSRFFDKQVVNAKTRENLYKTEYKNIEQKEAEATPKDLDIFQKGIRGFVQSAPITAAAISGGLINPALGLGIAGVHTAADSFTQAKMKGRSTADSLIYGIPDGIIEMATERLPLLTALKAFKKSGSDAVQSLKKFVVQDMLGEQLATGGQSLNAYSNNLDEALNDPNLTLAEKATIQAERQIVTAISTGLTTGSIAGPTIGYKKGKEAIGGAFNNIIKKANKENQIIAESVPLAPIDSVELQKTQETVLEPESEINPPPIDTDSVPLDLSENITPDVEITPEMIDEHGNVVFHDVQLASVYGENVKAQELPTQNKKISQVEKTISVLPFSKYIKIVKSPKDIDKAIPADAKGVWQGGNIYIVADNITDTQDAIRVALHEAVGHNGLRSVLGDKLDVTLDGIYKEHTDLIKKHAKALNLDIKDTSQRREATEELIASVAENIDNRPPGYMVRIFQQIKAALSKIPGIDMQQWGKKEILDLLARAKKQADNQSGKQAYTSTKGKRLMVAYHGTPHNVDKFSTDKIGTGEGAQAYGYGLYFAGNKEVAEYYRKSLTEVTKKDRFKWKNRTFERNTPEGHGLRLINDRGIREAKKLAKTWIGTEQYSNKPKGYFDTLNKVVQSISNKKEIEVVRGNLYQVDLKPKEDEYLLWDKPLSEQSEKVSVVLKNSGLIHDRDSLSERKEIFKKFDAGLITRAERNQMLDESPMPSFPDNMPGSSIYAFMPRATDKARSEYLHSLGLRGIKYLDGTSRGKGDGNYNYVIFDDKDVEIETRFSLNENQNSKFAQAVDNVQKGLLAKKYPPGTIIQLGTTPKVLKALGIKDLPITIPYSKIVTVMKPEDGKSGHGLTPGLLKKIPKQINNPVMVFKNKDPRQQTNSYVILTELKDKKQRPVIAALHAEVIDQKDVDSPKIRVNRIASIYGRNNANKYLKELIENNNAVSYYHKEKAERYFAPVQFRSQVAPQLSSDTLTNEDVFVNYKDPRFNNDIRFSRKVDKEKGIEILAPNGKPSSLTPEQYKQVRTPEFKKWFGDWEKDAKNASKVVDSNGEPLVVHHGSAFGKTFNQFKNNLNWFASDARVAKFQYTTMNSQGLFAPNSKVFMAFLNIRKPYTADAKNRLYDEINHKFQNETYETADELMGTIKQEHSETYDGGIILNIDEEQMFGGYGKSAITDDYIAFNPNQIKSATDNTGEFSVYNDDIRFSLGGKNAIGADTSKLAESIELEKQGKTVQQIWDKTGWIKGHDNKWRFEIDDSKAKIKKPFPEKNRDFKTIYVSHLPRGEITIGKILDHPVLYKNYPHIKNISITTKKGDGASLVMSNPTHIEIGEDVSMLDVKSHLIHEIQHAIQSREGFASGGTPNEFRTKKTNEKLKEETNKILMQNPRLKELLDNAQKGKGFDVTSREYKEYTTLSQKTGFAEIQSKYRKHETLTTPYDQYKNLTGEAEAREVQNRLDKSAVWRAKNPPSWDGVSKDDVIVRFSLLDDAIEASREIIFGRFKPERRKRWLLNTYSMLEPMLSGMFYAPHEVIRSLNTPTAKKLADLIYEKSIHEKRTKSGQLNDIVARRMERVGYFAQRLEKILAPYANNIGRVKKGHVGNENVNKILLTALHTGKVPKKYVKSYLALRKWLDDLQDYQKKAGIKLNYIKNYSPRVYNDESIIRKKDKFINMLGDNGLSKTAAEGVFKKIILGQGVAENLNQSEGRYSFDKDEQETIFIPRRVKGKEGHAVKSGHTKARTLDIPYKDLEPFLHTDLQATLGRYMNLSVKRAEYARTFGASEGKLNHMVKKILDELPEHNPNVDVRKALRHIYGLADDLQGIYKHIETPGYDRVNRTAGNFLTMVHLPLVTLSSLPEIFTPAAHLGNKKAFVKGLAKGFAHAANEATATVSRLITGKRNLEKTKQTVMAERLGVITQQAIMDAISTQFGSTSSALTNVFIKATLLEGLTKMQKVSAIEGFRYAARDWAVGAKKGDKHSIQQLKDYGIDVEQAKDWANNGFKDGHEVVSSILLGAGRFAIRTITTPTEATRSYWMKDPHLALIFQFQSFINSFGNTFLKHILVNMKRGHGLNKLNALPYVVLMVATAYAAQEFRDWWKYGSKGKPYKQDDMKRWINAIDRAGFTGNTNRLFELISPYRYAYFDSGANRFANLFGPAVGDSIRLLDKVVLSDKPKTRAKQTVNMIPVANALPFAAKENVIKKVEKLYK